MTDRQINMTDRQVEHDRLSTMRDRQADRGLWRDVCVFHMETSPEGEEGRKDIGAGAQ